MHVRSRRFPAALLAPVFTLVLVSAVSADVPTPTIEGPITSPGSVFLRSTSFDLGQVGYMEEEYFISGIATAYTNTGPLGPDGRWSVTPGNTAPYKTRISSTARPSSSGST
jgi:Alpha/beta hydrolase domain